MTGLAVKISDDLLPSGASNHENVASLIPGNLIYGGVLNLLSVLRKVLEIFYLGRLGVIVGEKTDKIALGYLGVKVTDWFFKPETSTLKILKSYGQSTCCHLDTT